MNKFVISAVICIFAAAGVFAQTGKTEKAEAVLKKAVQKLGGEKYLNVQTQIGRGKFTILRDGKVFSFQSFIDVIVYPDRERTEFRGGGSRSIQTNFENRGLDLRRRRGSHQRADGRTNFQFQTRNSCEFG